MVRTGDDSWDLASSVGATATMVAAARALASKEPDPLIHDPYAAPLVRAVGIDFFTMLVDRDISPSDAGDSSRTMADVMAVRTRFFDDFFLAGVAPAKTSEDAAGIGQAVILASGLDSRAYRLPWPDGTVVYEIDQPRFIEARADKLTERTRRLGTTINLADLFYPGERNSAADYLSNHGWDTDVLTTTDTYAANGFELPSDELATFGGDSGYLTATLN